MDRPLNGETDLSRLLKTMKPIHHPGDYVFCCINDLSPVNIDDIILLFREHEGCTVILKKEIADNLKLHYGFIAGWITLSVHSSLQAVGLTAAFSSALSGQGISCNVVAGYYHDHIFVDNRDTVRALEILEKLSLHS